MRFRKVEVKEIGCVNVKHSPIYNREKCMTFTFVHSEKITTRISGNSKYTNIRSKSGVSKLLNHMSICTYQAMLHANILVYESIYFTWKIMLKFRHLNMDLGKSGPLLVNSCLNCFSNHHQNKAKAAGFGSGILVSMSKQI